METGNRTPKEIADSIIAAGAPTEGRIRRYELAGRIGLGTGVGGGLAVGAEALASADPKIIYATLFVAAVGAVTAGLGEVADRMRTNHLRNLSRQIANIPRDLGEQNLPPFDPLDPDGEPVPLNPQPYNPSGGESAAAFLEELGITKREKERVKSR